MTDDDHDDSGSPSLLWMPAGSFALGSLSEAIESFVGVGSARWELAGALDNAITVAGAWVLLWLWVRLRRRRRGGVRYGE